MLCSNIHSYHITLCCLMDIPRDGATGSEVFVGRRNICKNSTPGCVREDLISKRKKKLDVVLFAKYVLVYGAQQVVEVGSGEYVQESHVLCQKG